MTEHTKAVLERRKRWFTVILIALALMILGASLAVNVSFFAEKRLAQGEAQTASEQTQALAEELADACKAGKVVRSISGDNLCDKAENLAQAPVITEGPQGAQGPRGFTGETGATGATGPTGPTGKTGATGPKGDPGDQGALGIPGIIGQIGATGATGANGLNGEPGKDGVAGPPGPVGPIGPAGKNGTNGSDGDDGRGISDVQCMGEGADSYWLITYTDGTTAQSSGPCKVAIAEPAPQPTSTP